MQVNPSIFKAYDIRGIVGKTVDEAFAEHLGRAFGTEAVAAKERAVAVGRDGRLSGPALSAALIRGLASTGLDVVDLGPVTTPMLYYVAATREQHGCRSGIQVTGSHNPKDYNGFKMVLAGRAIYGDDIQRLRQRIEQDDYATGRGRTAKMDIGAEYAQRIAGDCKLARRMKIVVDCGNGIPGASAPGILRALGCEVVELYSEVDGNFPNHHPDPSKPENLVELIQAVRDTGAELGLAFDGDGDRLGVVTTSGQIIYPDRQLMLFAADILKRQRGATVIYDVKCTQRLAPVISAAGGKPLMWKTGHSLIKAKLRETGAPIAGEIAATSSSRSAGTASTTPRTRLRGCWRSCRASATPAQCSKRCPPATARRSSTCPAPKASTTTSSSGCARARCSPARARSSPSTACARNTTTASASCGRPTPRRCWCCASRATRPRRWSASAPTSCPRCAA
jgi:phosphomannomutase